MPKGFREEFKLKLCLTPAQKQAWKIMERQAANIYKEVNYLMYEKHKLDFVIAENLLLDSKTFEKEAPDLLNFTRNQIASESYRYLKERGNIPQKGKHKRILISFPITNVAFSTTDNQFSAPYLGLVKFESNLHFNPMSMTDNQVWIRQNVRQIGFQIINNEYVCVVDCMDEEEANRRIKSEAGKIKIKSSNLLE